MASPVELVQCLDKLKSAYPNYQPDTTLTLDLWKEMFADMPGDTLKAAIFACLAEPRAFAPSAGEIRQAAMLLHAKAAGIPDAYQAYEEVVKMPASMESAQVITENGQNAIEYRPLKFSHPIVYAVALMVNWPKDFPTDMPGVDRSQFVKAYDAELARLMGDAGRLPMLTEYIESRHDLRGGAPLLAGAVRQLEEGAR